MCETFCDIVQTLSSLVSAVTSVFLTVAAFTISRPLKETLKTTFFSYDTEDNTVKLLKKAKKDIWIIVNYGDKLLEKYENELDRCLKRNINIHFLMLDENNYSTIDKYTGGIPKKEYVESSIKILKRLQKNHKKHFKIRKFDGILTQSYIAIDISKKLLNNRWSESSVIKVMLYQYKVPTSESSSTFMYYEKDKEKFERTVESIKKIWEDSKNFNLDNYFTHNTYKCKIKKV